MEYKKNIYIIGAGAVGKTLAVFLKNAGKQVVIIRGSVKDASPITERIRIVCENDAVIEADIEITTFSNFNSLNGMVVLANKSFGNAQLAIDLHSKAGSSPIVLLQNGLGVERPFMNTDFRGIYRAVLFFSSQFLDQNTLKFKPAARCPIGIEKGDTDTLNYIVEQLNTPALEFRSESDIQPLIWKKAIANCAFNSICPLLEVDNGIFHRNEKALAIARRVIAECVAIARGQGIAISEKEVEETLLHISRSSDGQLISTLQDIRNHRQTEIETFNLEIATIAQSQGNEDAVLETKLLGELTQLKADANKRDS